MTVYDRWHKSRPKPGEEPCGCRTKRVPTGDHGCDGRWQVRYRDDIGTQRKRNFDRRPDAERFDAEIKSSLHKGEYLDPTAGQITLSAYAKQWRASLTNDPVTLEGVDSRLSRWVYGQKIGSEMMTSLATRPASIRAWIKLMGESLAPSSIKIITDMVSAIFSSAVDDRIINRNPFKLKSVQSVRPVENDPKKVVPWTLAQVIGVAEALPVHLGAMAYLGAGCGLRQGELFGIAVEDLDFGNGMVRVNRQVRLVRSRQVFSLPKRNKTRSVPMPAEVAEYLQEHIKNHPPVDVTLPWRVPDGEPRTYRLLFTRGTREALHRGSFNYAWRGAIERAGIVPPTPPGARRKPYREHGCHKLRHTAASAWLAAGVDIVTVAEFLGHNDPAFTLRTYTHLMPSATERARRAMSVFFNDGACALDVP
ncbi:site-specific integrase [Streptosporangium sp. NPDC006007]|uniref:tyrosine-type recombinase/integrase n=1 Tax=Streptosporangium sp. NPDC006007 TaxID=3154575 RepID=UPI00339F283B